MPRKTKKQKIKALFHRTQEQVSQPYEIHEIHNRSQIREPSITSTSTIVKTIEPTISINEEQRRVVSDIYKTILLFTLLAIFQYAVYYGIVNNIIKI
jgi:hypothetical protein